MIVRAFPPPSRVAAREILGQDCSVPQAWRRRTAPSLAFR